jgi:transcriptional regulator with XRE-family HTH domain
MARRLPSELDKDLGTFLKKVMAENEWSYTQLARKTGVPQSMLHGIISGEKFATLHLVSRIAKSLGVGLGAIFPKRWSK